MGLTIKDFQPINQWKVDEDGDVWRWNRWEGKKHDLSKMAIDINKPGYIIDQTTGKKFENISTIFIRFEYFLISMATPFMHTAASIANVAYRTFKSVILYQFWAKRDDEKYHFKARLIDFGKDISRVLATPICLCALQIAALYAMIRPHDGRKLYVNLEKLLYEHPVLAPRFNISSFFDKKPVLKWKE